MDDDKIKIDAGEWEKTKRVFDEIKAMCKRHQIVVIVGSPSHANRQINELKDLPFGDFSEIVSEIPSVYVSLILLDEPKGEMTMKVLKKRRVTNVKEMTREDLESVVTDVQAVLWPFNDERDQEYEWGADTIEYVARALDDHGLGPGTVVPVPEEAKCTCAARLGLPHSQPCEIHG